MVSTIKKLIFFLLIPAISHASCSFVKATACTASVGSSYNCSITATTGNLLVIGNGNGDASGAIATISDGVNSYVTVSTASNGTFDYSQMWYAKNITGGNLTLNFSNSGSIYWVPIVFEFSGESASPLVTFVQGNGGTTPQTSSNFSGTSSGNLIVDITENYYTAAVLTNGSTNPSGMTTPTNGTNNEGTDAQGNIMMAYSTSGAPYSGAVTTNVTSTVYGSIIGAAFACSGGGGGSSSAGQKRKKLTLLMGD